MRSIIDRVREEYSKSIFLDDEDIMLIDAILCVLMVTRHVNMTEPDWLMVTGAPASGKTESLRPFDENALFCFTDSTTENALASGYTDRETGKDPSLLGSLDGRVLVFKDLTSIMDENPKILDKILGTLRAAYDGSFCKHSGKEGAKEYKAEFGVIACTTDIIDAFTERHSQLGQRFTMFRIGRQERTHAQRISRYRYILQSVTDGTKAKRREELKEYIKGIAQEINDIARSGRLPRIPDEINTQLCSIADLMARLRTSAAGDDVLVTPEGGLRATQTFMQIAMARALLDGRDSVNEEDLNLIRRLAVDTLDTPRLRAIHSMFTSGSPGSPMAKSVDSIIKLLDVSWKRVMKMMNQFHYSGIVISVRDPEEKTALFRISPEAYAALKETKYFEGPHMPTIIVKRS